MGTRFSVSKFETSLNVTARTAVGQLAAVRFQPAC
ncbi:hypothetical protein ARTHRO9AX_20160 [Arthrobacter sp. 9AX]|nr:hypothetical protein ARTHRO9AX_20160 [Arthrobacter sp. 9AX]